MAHEISIVNGQAEAAYAIRPAWHGLGIVLGESPDSDKMKKAAHLGWTVGTDVVVVRGVAVPGYKATIREDTGKVLGIVGADYPVVQNEEGFALLDSLMMDGIMRYEAAGALRDGRIVWILARMPSAGGWDGDEIADGDSILRYVLFSNSHDGTMRLHAVPTSVRVVCANTLRIATAKDIGVRHSGDMSVKLEAIRKQLSQYDEQFTLFRDKARMMAGLKVGTKEAAAYINSLFPPVEKEGRGKTIRDGKVKVIQAATMNARNAMPGVKGTWWGLLNAVTEITDHASTFKGKDNEQVRAENRMMSIMDGPKADFKVKALDLALAMAGV